MSKDNQAIKISVEPNLDIGNKDQDKINGTKAKKISKSEIHTTVNNFNSDPIGLETLLIKITNKIENLENQLEQNSVSNLLKKYESKIPVLYDYIPADFINFLQQNNFNYDLITDIRILKEFSEQRQARNTKDLVVFTWTPKLIIFYDITDTIKFNKLSEIWKDILIEEPWLA
ncbi:hypothetical protein SSYRP_v1c00700 [Spiroplasma syrphidicola EA-1]|uniref:Uncharacterized protein n=1 Tax=Spiroplasma syrphidicola EA-1 TaxID=1276229 RepID=R4UK74_9MOLU|nr:hypothetical protein [Spiroplasma syrphidicola]AGM25666.1 hypothetical protein SSYRP_v1c00700 [Spiroplasma syrphidicola EA-1]